MTAVAPVQAGDRSQSPPTGRFAKIWYVPRFLCAYFLGAFFCSFPLGSIFVLGWTYRAVQRSTIKAWWKRSGKHHKAASFRDFARGNQIAAPHERWPNWIVRQGLGKRLRRSDESSSRRLRRVREICAGIFQSLWINFVHGLQWILTTWVLTIPGCVLWLFAWQYGWTVSFHKGYEESPIGPLVGLLGVALFIAAMFYVPLAQARQAATDSWRAFFQFRVNWRLIASRWGGFVILAAAYAMLSAPISFLKVLPASPEQIEPNFAQLTDAEVVARLRSYFFRAAIILFPCFIALRLAAARLYASSVLASLRRGVVIPDQLEPGERNALASLDLLGGDPTPIPHAMARAAKWTYRRFYGSLMAAIIAVLWFAFVAQIFISEFLNYHPFVGWMNQPLVQLPYLRYIPGHLTP